MFRLLVMQAVLAVGGRTLVYLELGDGSIQEKGRLDLEHDIACLDVTPVGERCCCIVLGCTMLGGRDALASFLEHEIACLDAASVGERCCQVLGVVVWRPPERALHVHATP